MCFFSVATLVTCVWEALGFFTPVVHIPTRVSLSMKPTPWVVDDA